MGIIEWQNPPQFMLATGNLIKRRNLIPSVNALTAHLGGDGGDIACDSPTKRIEVKATGRSAFQHFGNKDIHADFLVWIAFADYFMPGAKRQLVEVLHLRTPSKFFKKVGRVTLAEFKKRAYKAVSTSYFNPEKL